MTQEPTADRPPDAPASFEVALEKLQRIVQELEQGDLGLSASLQKYEEGIRCLRFCHRELASAQQRIELLTGVDAAGQATTEPFDEAAMTLPEKADTRSQRRTRTPRRGSGRSPNPGSDDDPGEDPALF